jgi:hypothetical protein
VVVVGGRIETKPEPQAIMAAFPGSGLSLFATPGVVFLLQRFFVFVKTREREEEEDETRQRHRPGQGAEMQTGV